MRKKKTPLRKCVVTQEMKPKKELIRVVRTPEGEVVLDPTSKKSGRGAYVSSDLDIINQAEKKQVLDRHLKASVPASLYEEMRRLHLREQLL
ncbi:RNase P modulator RnpM [Bacillus daqingensis]|uniref:RNase P modulator RnpM n=1 Tax=Bacillus daqingensis TaxID=872396 RepID=A0ABV9NUB6_9BACI